MVHKKIKQKMEYFQLENNIRLDTILVGLILELFCYFVLFIIYIMILIYLLLYYITFHIFYKILIIIQF
jgi:hypothetical protein